MSVSESNNNIRIRTTPLGTDRYVKVNLNQNFDFLEILSLRIGQEEVYKKHCSDYGVIAGRVVCNKGVGVPNAKVSVFIPITEDDKEKSLIRAIYPYEELSDRGYDNIEYNLLPQSPKIDDICHTPVGSFPEKRRILDCEPWCEIYGRYYKFTTSTNTSGDFLIFGVPTGKHTVHLDVDLSDIGYLSQKPYDMVRQGTSVEQFESYNKFASSPNIRELPQIKTQNKTINVLPFWGDVDVCEIGINRVDFDLGYNIETNAFFIGSIFGDSEKNSVSKNCRPRKKLGYLNQLITGPGAIEMIRKTPFGGIEVYSPSGNKTIDNDGTWVLQLPMNLEHKITNEFGELVDSGNPEVGIATKANYRFKISMGDTRGFARVRSRAKFLVPNYGDYTFDDTLQDYTSQGRPNWANMEWNGIYTVRQFISRYSNKNENKCKDNNFTGIKDVYEGGNNNPFPYNRYDRNTNPLFWFLCLLAVSIVYVILLILNALISLWNSLPRWIRGDGQACVGVECSDTTYAPGCIQPKDGQSVNNNSQGFRDCIQITLAEALNVFSFYFTNDWINGALFAFLFKYKYKKNGREKFCNAEKDMGSQYVKDQVCDDNDFPSCVIVYDPRKGVITQRDYELYYAAMIDGHYLYPTDIYNLGSSKLCDIFGKPKIIENIPSTTFVGLELLSDATIDEKGFDPFILTVNCTSIKQNITQCKNISRICEIGVDPSFSSSEPVQNDSLEEETRDIRANLECLNSGQCSLSIPNGDGGFNNDWRNYRRIYYTKDGYKIGAFGYDEGNRNKLMFLNGLNNSFYFYFGLLPGRTAIDKLVSVYFKPCERKEPCPIRIVGEIENNVCISGNSGSITAIPEGGVPPYKFSWFKGQYSDTMTPICVSFNFTPTPITLPSPVSACSSTISGLYSDKYTVVVKDSVEQICKKTFEVVDPLPFEVSVNYSPYICVGANNGFIEVLPFGGTPPYTIYWLTPPHGADVGSANTTSFFIYNLPNTTSCSQPATPIIPFNPNPNTGNLGSTGYTFLANASTNFSGTLNLSTGETITISQPFINSISNNNTVIFNVAPNATSGYNTATSTFTAPYSGIYTFSIVGNYNYSAFYTAQNSFANFDIRIVLSHYMFGSTTAITYNLYTISNSVGSTSINGTNIIVPPSPLISSEDLYLNIGDQVRIETYCDTYISPPTSAATPFNLSFNFSNGKFGNLIYLTSGSADTTFYNAIIYDSAGNYGCLSLSGLSIDITTSCGFSLSATSNAACSTTSNNGSVTWGPINGGVPPFTYVIENNSGLYFSASSYSDTFTKNSLGGNTCPNGSQYTVTCIDNCGDSASMMVNVDIVNLRYLGYLNLSDPAVTNPPYHWYVFVYVGGMGEYAYTINFPSNNYYVGNNAFYDGNWANPSAYWYTLDHPTNTPTSFLQKKDSTTNAWFEIVRTPLNLTQDRIQINNRVGANPQYFGGLSNSFNICISEKLMFMAVYVVPSTASTDKAGWSIQNVNCATKLSNNFS